jgi:hypothetical protein
MLRITTTPPAHSVDDVPTWIWGQDPAWDVERINAERNKLGPRTDDHPVVKFVNGQTRYSLDAQITIPEAIREPDGPATAPVTHWLKKGGKPTCFELRSLGGRDWAIADTAIATMGFYEFARRGLVRVCDAVGEDGQPMTVRIPRGEDGAIAGFWLDSMSREHRALLDDLGHAVYRLSKNEVARAEGKP